MSFASLRWVLSIAVLAYVATASAQQPTGGATGTGSTVPSSTGAGATAGTTAGSGSDASGTVGFQRKTSLTPEEQLAEASKHLGRMEQAGGGVRRMLEEARKQRDVVRTLCLNDKLSQVDVAIRSGRDRRSQLEAAVQRKDAELSNHEFTILTVLRQRVEQLVAESNQCIGQEAAFVGDTRTRVTIDPTIPPDETPYPSTDPSLVVGPPPCTSCTL